MCGIPGERWCGYNSVRHVTSLQWFVHIDNWFISQLCKNKNHMLDDWLIGCWCILWRRGMPQHVYYTPRQTSADKMLQMILLHRLCHFLRAEFLVCCACRGSNSRFCNKKNSQSAPARVKPLPRTITQP